MSDTLRTAAQQALEALEGVITDLRAAKAESDRDWSLLEATQESLREHMAEVQRLRAALAQPATIAEWWAAKQAASGEPFGYLWPTGMHPEFRFYQQKRDGVDGMPLYATAQPAPARVPPSVSPEAHADFVRALHGGKGDLDAWLECYDEIEVRAHVLALVQQPAASGEPVAWTYTGIKADGSEHGPHLVWNPAYMDAMSASKGAKATPLYAAPQPAPARVPLTDEQINQITAAQWGAGLGAPYAAYRAYARAIEAAHGITPTKEA